MSNYKVGDALLTPFAPNPASPDIGGFAGPTANGVRRKIYRLALISGV